MATKGMFGIARVEYRDDCMTCQECYRHWLEDITPAGRCPWEHLHAKDLPAHIALRRRKAMAASM